MPLTDPDGTIPVATAKEWAANWRDYLLTADSDFITRSFEIPIVDFQNILLYNPTAQSVKAFIGLKDIGAPLTAQLMLVPVVAGQEVHTLQLVGGLVGDVQSNIYDMTTACPPTCSTIVGDTLDN
ncbi:hypothetical protein NAF17_00550 [Mucilaginibacter sp. RB4R14]|uniref:hypothetical protein n=1 Tax=Mucilaginibacter aurantiaciroseus TaxID=2949308 RepID=UPI0020914B37|nr:hypothetical protein [Mucilaginibacter aurantiaciroseus]MCO5934012.1 hypothetical protein [Mucilaginibacter aurantiaciroseus]